MADPGIVTASSIAIGQTVVAYQFFLPRIGEVRKADGAESGMRGDVLLGQAAAGVVSLAVGALLGWLTGSSIPVWVTVFIALVIGAFYHLAMVGSQ